MSESVFDAARVVVKPIQRPKNMMVIHNSSDKAAAVLADTGARTSLSH